MHLKRLEIQGFKSFADKIELHFNPGVTGIVGPNGSGKSNISDAIRWVLGEQSAKSLRGAKMEDIIFSGSDKRRPVGMAEVSLTLDNSNGIFPLDYSEVTVTRRVFRSGDSEFLINKSPCRLRDIHELFMDTGVGREGYSIIGQGKIDEILNARSEDRRQLIEEAAGIVKYKNRKLQAAKKLADTEQNLMRISDIISELSAQVGPLQEQAATAEEFLNFKEELSKLEINLYVHQLEEVGGKLAEINTEMDEKKQAALTVETQLRGNESRVEELKLRISKLDEEISGVQQAVFDLSSAVERNEAAVNVAEERRRGLNRDRDRLTAELADMKHRIDEVKNQYAGEEDALAKIRQEIAAGHIETAAREAELADLVNSLAEGDAGIESGKGDIIEILHGIAEVRNEIGNYAVQEKNHEKRIAQLTVERAAAEKQAAENSTVLAFTKQDCNAVTVNIKKNDAALTELAQEQGDSEKKLFSLRGDLSAQQKTVGVKESRLRVLKEMQQQYEGFHKGVREVLKAGQAGKLQGICGVLAELLQVPEEYAVAIEVALGGAVQFIVSGTDGDAQRAIEYLKANKAGRATFLPLNTIKNNEHDKSLQKIINSKGCLGTAAGLVKIDEQYNNILQFLLGRIAIFQNLELARQVAKDAGYRYKFVTLDGEIINPGGSFTGGSFARGNATLLGRMSEIDNLEKELTRLQGVLEKQRADENNKQQEINQIKYNIEHLRNENQMQQLQLTGIKKDLEQREVEQVRIERLIKSADLEIEQESVEIKRLRDKREVLKEKLGQLENKNKELEHSIGRLQEAVKDQQEFREQITSRITASRVRLAALQQEETGYEELLARAHRSVEEYRQQAVDKEAKLAEIGLTGTRLDEEITVLKEQIIRQVDKKGSTGEQLNALKGERQSDRAGLNDLEIHIKQLQKQFGYLQEQAHSFDVRRARLEMEMENARQRLMEEHGLTFEEAVLNKTEIKNRREVASRIKELKGHISGLGTVNLGAIEEFARVNERYEFLTAQHKDLEEAKNSLYTVIAEMDDIMTGRFREAFQLINSNFREVFSALFGGGNADLQLTDSTDMLETGIEIIAQPPGKKPQHLSLLSGGERALTAIALLFAILKVKPSPFCVLDEIEAALDEANVDRFAAFMKEFADQSQFIVVTHRKGTMEVADILYGVTMDESGVTKMVSMRLAEAVDKVS